MFVNILRGDRALENHIIAGNTKTRVEDQKAEENHPHKKL